MSFRGLSLRSHCAASMRLTTSIPPVTSPNTTCLPARHASYLNSVSDQQRTGLSGAREKIAANTKHHSLEPSSKPRQRTFCHCHTNHPTTSKATHRPAKALQQCRGRTWTKFDSVSSINLACTVMAAKKAKQAYWEPLVLGPALAIDKTPAQAPKS